MPHGGPNHDPFGNPITPGGGNVGTDPGFGGSDPTVGGGGGGGDFGPITVNANGVSIGGVTIGWDEFINLFSGGGDGGGGGGGGGPSTAGILGAGGAGILAFLALLESNKFSGKAVENIERGAEASETVFQLALEQVERNRPIADASASALTGLLERGPRIPGTPPLNTLNPFTKNFPPLQGATFANDPSVAPTSSGAGPPPIGSGPGVSQPNAGPITSAPPPAGGVPGIPPAGFPPAGFPPAGVPSTPGKTPEEREREFWEGLDQRGSSIVAGGLTPEQLLELVMGGLA